MVSFADKPLLDVTTVAEWEAWLEANQQNQDGVRVRIRKKAAVDPGLDYEEAVLAALCFGWIDGQTGAHDEQFRVQAFTPRRRASPWSQVNVERVEALIAEGRMREGGHAEIARAKADGRWDAAYRQKGAELPDDLAAAIAANPAAAEFFATLTKQNRFAFIFRLSTVRTPENRAKRIADFVAKLARGEAFH
ncbi:YdeI/OmpD-associated family protein [Schumannella soli]|uniref:Bacteriocin-protection protein, YdeI/OmpD-associated family n=1 Tax=Schumannella soli TaxID=2590779 RepID=A0A506Y585_9MICO|nr:YdeI/OmpD-associated family protein [Schumannella soli]TPW77766.1 bacteriocin-protection protein, YdeI/OmpD-associated family [Schumannella soli]